MAHSDDEFCYLCGIVIPGVSLAFVFSCYFFSCNLPSCGNRHLPVFFFVVRMVRRNARSAKRRRNLFALAVTRLICSSASPAINRMSTTVSFRGVKGVCAVI